MGKKKQLKYFSDINGALAFLLFCGASLGIITNREASNQAVAQQAMPENNFFDYIQPLLYSRGLSKIAQAIHTFADDNFVSVLNTIIENTEWPLSLNDKLLLIMSLAALYKEEPYKQNQVLSMISNHADLFSNSEPLLYVLAHNKSNSGDIPIFLRWIGTVKNHNQPFINKAIQEGLLYAVHQNDIHSFNYMISQGVPLSKVTATRMLWDVIEGQKNPAFIPELIRFKAQIDTPKHSYTPLMQAILYKNKPIVNQLLKAGANPNLVIDNTIGSALQIVSSEAFQAHQDKRVDDSVLYNELERLLRSFGAR